MTDTNWPNPERPGVPMFPERDGLHVLKWGNSPILIWDKAPHPQAAMEIWEWDSKTQKWGIILAKNMVREGYSYISPILTPTQISEMLAGERERISDQMQNILTLAISRFELNTILETLEGLRPKNDRSDWTEYAQIRSDLVDEAQALFQEIRNLGAAP